MPTDTPGTTSPDLWTPAEVFNAAYFDKLDSLHGHRVPPSPQPAYPPRLDLTTLNSPEAQSTFTPIFREAAKAESSWLRLSAISHLTPEDIHTLQCGGRCRVCVGGLNWSLFRGLDTSIVCLRRDYCACARYKPDGILAQIKFAGQHAHSVHLSRAA